MTRTAAHFRTRMIYGAIALLPIFIAAFLAVEMFGVLKTLAEPLAPYMTLSPYLETILLVVLAVLILAVVCYAVGVLVSTQLGKLTVGRVEAKLRAVIPGYEIAANLLRGIAGSDMSYPPALVTLLAPGTAVLAFVMEDDGDTYLTIYVPSSPLLTAGTIHVVDRARVRLIEGSSMGAAQCITQWGLGLRVFRGPVTPPVVS
jgi:uncharacterized membrane protein